MAKWHHAPVHHLCEAGVYMVTAGTRGKEPLFAGAERLDLLQDRLLELAAGFGLRLQAWAAFSNHYHWIAEVPGDASRLTELIRRFHSITARELNALDGAPGRQVWFQYWDSRITHQTSYLARLNYVYQNPVKHRLVEDPETYRWCSAGSFRENAEPDFFRTVRSFSIERLRVVDGF